MGNKITAGLAGLALVGGGAVVGVNLANSGEKPAENPADTSEPFEPTPVDSGEPNEPADNGENLDEEFTEADLTVEALEIPAGLSAEDFARTLTERNLAVWKPLQNDEFFSYVLTEFGNGTPLADTVRERSNELAAIVHKSTFTEEALSTSNVQYYLKIRDNVIFASLQGWLITYESGNPEDIEPYDGGTNLISATEVSKDEAGGREINMVTQQYDNRDLNRMGTKYVNSIGGEVSFNPLTYTVNTVVVGGVEKISNIELVDTSQ